MGTRHVGKSWSRMPGMSITTMPCYSNINVTITFSAEFLVFSKIPLEPPLPLESIEVKCAIYKYIYGVGWSWFGVAMPGRVVMLTEEPDATEKNWESRSFTWFRLNLPGGEPAITYRFIIRWRLYPASEDHFVGYVRARTLIVTLVLPEY